MKYRAKAIPAAFLLCAFLSACGQDIAAESPEACVTKQPAKVVAPPLFMPPPLPEGAPLTLAGQELDSAVMEDVPDGVYGFSTGTAANLEGWFQLLDFRAEEPFYEYYDRDDILRLALWYDSDSGIGLGIRYRNYGDPLETYLYGFGFRFTSWVERNEEDEHQHEYGWYRWEDDPFVLPLCENSGVPDYEERRELDEAGRLISLASYGTDEGWAGRVKQPMPLHRFTYDYDDEGLLRHRSVSSHNTLFTTNPGMDGYYDDQGRLAYEYGYITHGSTDIYYIYEGDAAKPSYALYLDESHGTEFPRFVRYPS